ncbi:unnamed protein product [Hermetia illucens]|uniref:Glycine N-methyltransferase n=1 Tax=Hermetia illucens TaxID=343691 RepID=A0A7R8Z088_HERIL|nr:glycine N-methyltransferase-like [Hermetia illucens]CAD7092379.1 unnamed protein product [Hermetia illucens]
MPEADTVFRARSEGVSAEGVRDQYADGKAAKVWEVFIGDKKSRTDNYKNFLVDLLKKKGCKRILDVACGTGVDSIMLIEEGFEVVSVDASDKMLKYAIKERWNRRKEPAFDKWIIEEANWLTLYDDVKPYLNEGFDAVVCLGNSFPHLLDAFGDQREHKLAIRNFRRCTKPGGLFLIDHRNYDNILANGKMSMKNVYYNAKHTVDIKSSVLYVSGKPRMVTRDYVLELNGETNEFRLSYYPHLLQVFTALLDEVFENNGKNHIIYGDFKPLDESNDNPSYYVHIMENK